MGKIEHLDGHPFDEAYLHDSANDNKEADNEEDSAPFRLRKDMAGIFHPGNEEEDAGAGQRYGRQFQVQGAVGHKSGYCYRQDHERFPQKHRILDRLVLIHCHKLLPQFFSDDHLPAEDKLDADDKRDQHHDDYR